MEYYLTWEPVLRFNGRRTYTAYMCPHCKGSGDSPYHDEFGNIILCECCGGDGFKNAR